MREARLLCMTTGSTPSSTPGGPGAAPERISPTNAPAVMASARAQLDALRRRVGEVEGASIAEATRVTVLEGTHAQLAQLQERLTPPSGMTPLPVNDESARAALVAEVQTTQQTVMTRLQRFRELASNSVYQFFSNSGLGAPVRMVTGFFGSIAPIFSEIGSLIGPTMTAIWKPFQRMGSPIMNFFSGIAAKFNPQLAEQMRVRAAAERQKELVVEALTYQLGRGAPATVATPSVPASPAIPARQLPPANARTDEDTEHITALFQIQQRSGRDPTAFASLVVRRLPPMTPNPVPFAALVAAAELAFPVDGTPVVVPTARTTSQTFPIANLDTHVDSVISVINGDIIRVTLNAASAGGGVTVDGTVVAATAPAIATATPAGTAGGAVSPASIPWMQIQRTSPGGTSGTNGALVITINGAPATRPSPIHSIAVGGKTIRVQFP